jgi:hypothetical protein
MEESVNNLFVLKDKIRRRYGVEEGKSWQPSHIVDLDVYKLFRGARVYKLSILPLLKCLRTF